MSSQTNYIFLSFGKMILTFDLLGLCRQTVFIFVNDWILNLFDLKIVGTFVIFNDFSHLCSEKHLLQHNFFWNSLFRWDALYIKYGVVKPSNSTDDDQHHHQFTSFWRHIRSTTGSQVTKNLFETKIRFAHFSSLWNIETLNLQTDWNGCFNRWWSKINTKSKCLR